MVGIKSIVSQIPEEIGEAAVKPVIDEVGKAIEQGVQSVFSPHLTPQPFDSAQGKQRKLEEQKKLAHARRVIEHYRKIEEAQRAVRQAKKQEEMQKKQEQSQKEQAQEIKKEQKKQQIPEEVRARAMAETKAGRGVGG